MSRYIKLDDLMKYPIRIDHYDEEHGNRHFVLGIESVIEYAEALPTIDIVRCKECKHIYTMDCAFYEVGDDVNLDDFCSYGERSE